MLAYQTGEGGVLVIVPTKFDHPRKMLPDITSVFDNPNILTDEYSKVVEYN
jgi:hypothetical protein